jgi:hypothetical protein
MPFDPSRIFRLLARRMRVWAADDTGALPEAPDAPHLARFAIDLDELQNRRGDIHTTYEGILEHYGWSTLEAAKAAAAQDELFISDEEFADPVLQEYYRAPNVHEFTFAYVGGRWVFQELVATKYGCTPVLWRALLGDDSGPSRVLPENAHWLTLIQ